MNKEEIINKLANKSVLTIEEARLLLDTICQLVIDDLKITRDFSRKCIQSHDEIVRICLMSGINFSGLYNEAIGLDEIPHYYNFIGLNTNLGGIWFLVDPTYIQFDCDRYFVDHTEKTFISPGRYFPKEFKDELLNYGYITYTKEHFYSYINSFVLSINGSDNLYKKKIKVEDVIKKAIDHSRLKTFSTIETIQDFDQKAETNPVL